MSSKPHVTPCTSFPLPRCSVLALTGPDATAFAQSQFANDVATLPTGHWQWNAWINPKGRLIALFRLLRLDSDTLLVALPDFPADQLADRLARFVFRSKLRLSPLALRTEGSWLQEPTVFNATLEGSLDTGLRLAISPDRSLQLLPEAETESEPDDEPQRWRLADIRAGIPRIDPADVEAFTAHMLGLDALGAFSLKKGCFPGHEILARSHYLGQVKRTLQRLSCSDPLPQRGEITSAGQPVGRLICSAEDESGGSEGLAVLAVDAASGSETLQVDAKLLKRA